MPSKVQTLPENMDDESSTTGTEAAQQPVDWQLVYGHGEPLLIAHWPTNTSQRGIRSVPFTDGSHNHHNHQHPGCTPPQEPGAPANATTPILHIPTCRLSFRTAPYHSRKQHHKDPTVRVEIEEVALHRDVIQGFLSHLRPPASADGTVRAKLSTKAHYDDDDEWVYSRCTLSEFTEMDRDQATFLSNNGMLCCWASVVLTPWEEEGTPGRAVWDLGFMIHRVGLCTERQALPETGEDDNDPSSCACVY
ncbi:hypothetical protein QBC44DRAFT_394706 [Cladorrhinum sp. PSN332]|nr:hypothetical protein QBC44DRAFT_394706 [Cladorrhinum sp. PSN332]